MITRSVIASLCLSWIIFVLNSQTAIAQTAEQLALSHSHSAAQLQHRPPTHKVQASTNPDEDDDVIEKLMHEPEAFYQGTGITQVHSMGDTAAQAEIRVLSSKPLNDQQIGLALDILHESFERLIAVHPVNRAPKATLFLLNYFELIASGDETKQKVEATRQFVVNAKPVVMLPNR